MFFHHKPVPAETPEQVAEELRRGEVVLIDVREPNEYFRARIEGAIPYPLSRFDAHAIPHPPGKEIIFISENSKRSATAYEKAEHAGMHPRAQMAGGMNAWRQAGLPVLEGSQMRV